MTRHLMRETPTVENGYKWPKEKSEAKNLEGFIRRMFCISFRPHE